MPTLIDMTGRTFGRLTVIERSPRDPLRGAHWLCACICGGSAIARGADLRNGHTTSCGCVQREAAAAAGLARKPAAELKYGSAHMRVKYDRGRAAEYRCVDCGEQAAEWSLKHDAQETHLGPARGDFICRYSGNADDYEPRCKRCHTAYDKAG